jgi:AmmeMemoRadiSam system protein A/AmmeMemoRadiSam system protein B
MTEHTTGAGAWERRARSRLPIVSAVMMLLCVAVAVVVWLGRETHEAPVSRPAAPLEVLAGPPRVRPPAVAGQFYPSDPSELFGVHAILVPHAGYPFSAAVAAASFRELGPNFRRVFILASNHNSAVSFANVSLPDVTSYAIPGAEIPLSAVVKDLRDPTLFVHEPLAHVMHMVEVELPFLHQLRGRPQPADYAIVPMILGRMDTKAVDRLAALLDGYADSTTVFVFSADLSHYYPYETARRLDQYTVDAVMARDRSAIARAVTDGDQVLDTMLALAQRRGWQPTFLMARNSGDATGEKDRVVGYAAIAFHDPFSLTEAEKRDLLAFARTRVEEQVRHGRVPEPDVAWLDKHPIFRISRGVFVTLEKKGRLRGCIGDLMPSKPLYLGVQESAVNAAVNDHRFPPVSEDEMRDLSISISVLDYPARVHVSRPEEYLQVLRPGKDGVILDYNGKRSTFLPKPEDFLSSLALKQGSPADAWRSPSAVLYRYEAYAFGEGSTAHAAASDQVR